MKKSFHAFSLIFLFLFSCSSRPERIKILFSNPLETPLEGKIAVFLPKAHPDIIKDLFPFLSNEMSKSYPKLKLLLLENSFWEEFGYSKETHITNALLESREKGIDFLLLIWVRELKESSKGQIQSIALEVRFIDVKKRLDYKNAIVFVNYEKGMEKNSILLRIAKIIVNRLI